MHLYVLSRRSLLEGNTLFMKFKSEINVDFCNELRFTKKITATMVIKTPVNKILSKMFPVNTINSCNAVTYAC